MPTPSIRRLVVASPVWVPVAFLSLVIRTPLALLPGPGRDEAAYYHWAQNAEAAYAPLMLAAVRLLESIGLPALAAVRLPSLTGGLLCIALFDRLLATAQVGRRDRLVALMTLALTPWQVLVGSVLHPDPLFLAALLGLAMALRSRHALRAALWSGAAALAKPTGIVLLPVVAIWIWRSPGLPVRHRRAAGGLLAALAVPAVVWLSPSMVREILEFGHLDPSLPAGRRIGIAVVSLILEGGVLLPLAALQGTAEGIRKLRSRSPGDDLAVFALAMTLIALFLGGAVFNNQIKGSWFLPAFVLLWPRRPLSVPRWATLGLLIASALAGVIMVGAMRFPEISARVETELKFDHIYSQRAGTREQRVSSTRTFSERFREFEDLSDVTEAALRQWRDATGRRKPPGWIVSDDYGFAARLAYQWRADEPRILIPADGLFNRDAAEAARGHKGDMLIVAVREPPDEVWPDGGPVVEIGVLTHPITGDPVRLGVLTSVTVSPTGP